MKIYKIEIDTSEQTTKALNVPKGEAYGIQVSATANGRPIAKPICQLIVGSDAVQPTKTLDNGTFLFEIAPDTDLTSKRVMVHVISGDSPAMEEWNGNPRTYMTDDATKDNTDLGRIIWAGPVWWYEKKRTETEPQEFYADGELITFTDLTVIGYFKPVKVGGRIKQVWTVVARIPSGKYYPREITRAICGGEVGNPAEVKVRLVVREEKGIVPDYSGPIESIDIGGVEYVPTTLVVDGVEYSVLAAKRDEEEPVDSAESDLTSGE